MADAKEYWKTLAFSISNQAENVDDLVAFLAFKNAFGKIKNKGQVSFKDAVDVLAEYPFCPLIAIPPNRLKFMSVHFGDDRILVNLFSPDRVERRADVDVTDLIERAKVSRDAFRACKFYAALNLVAPGAPNRILQEWSAEYLLDNLKEPSQKGPSPNLYFYRDRIISALFNYAVELGFQRYRNETSSATSAGDVVCATLAKHGYHISIKAIEKIGPSSRFPDGQSE